MEIFNELSKSLGFDEYLPKGFRFTVVGKSGGYVQNVKKIVDVKKEAVTVSFDKGIIVFSGEDLFVRSFSGGDLSIKGRITRVEVKDVDG